MSPYRDRVPPPTTEEEMWQSLDEALEWALRDPVWAWGMAWSIAREAADQFPDVRDAAGLLMEALFRPAGP